MFPILNVDNLGKGRNKMSNLNSEINAMTPEQVMSELPLAKTELTKSRIKLGIVWALFGAGILYLVFGM